jgi:hypothetical protein
MNKIAPAASWTDTEDNLLPRERTSHFTFCLQPCSSSPISGIKPNSVQAKLLQNSKPSILDGASMDEIPVCAVTILDRLLRNIRDHKDI